jgi:hypothetical protein
VVQELQRRFASTSGYPQARPPPPCVQTWHNPLKTFMRASLIREKCSESAPGARLPHIGTNSSLSITEVLAFFEAASHAGVFSKTARDGPFRSTLVPLPMLLEEIIVFQTYEPMYHTPPSSYADEARCAFLTHLRQMG